MVPGLYERLHQGVKEARRLINEEGEKDDTQAGIDQQGRLVTAAASYGDLYLPWGRGNPEADSLRKDLTGLLDKASELEEKLSLNQRTVAVVKAHELDPDNLSLNLKQVSRDLVEVLQTPACYLIRSRESLFGLLSELLETENEEQSKQKLREELESGFNRFLSVYDSDSVEEDSSLNALGSFLTAIRDWRTGLPDDLYDHCLEEAEDRIDHTCELFDEVLTTFTRSSHEKLNGKPSPRSTSPSSESGSDEQFVTPPQGSGSDDSFATPPPEPEPEPTPAVEDCWRWYPEGQAAELREMDRLLKDESEQSLAELLSQIQPESRNTDYFLEHREAELREKISRFPALLFKQLEAQDLSKYDIETMTGQGSRKKKPLQQLIISAVRNLKIDDNYRLQLQTCKASTAALTLFIRHQKQLHGCQSSHLEQVASLLKMCPDKELEFVEILSRKYQSKSMFSPISFMGSGADVLKITDFTHDQGLITSFVQQHPSSVVSIDDDLFLTLLEDPEMSATWQKQLSSSASFSKSQWLLLTTGNPAPLHRILEECLQEPVSKVIVPSSATACVRDFLATRPEATAMLLQKPCHSLSDKFGSTATVVQIAHGMVREDRAWLTRHKHLPGIEEFLVHETIQKLSGREPVEMSSEFMHTVSQQWAKLPTNCQKKVFTSLSSPNPALTAEQQNEIVTLLSHNQAMLVCAANCLDFPSVLQNPWRALPAASDSSGKEQMEGLVLMAIDQQPLPAPSKVVRDTQEDRLALTVWFRKHRHLIYRSSDKDARHPSIPTTFKSKLAHRQLHELINSRLSLSKKISAKEAESASTLICCAFSDEMLLELLGALSVDNLPVPDRVFIATHRSREVAAEIIRSFRDNPDEQAMVAIAKAHPGAIPESIWQRMPVKAQMRLAVQDPAIAQALLSKDLPLSQRAWLNAHCPPPSMKLLDDWRQDCANPDMKEAGKQKWLQALEQLAASDEGASEITRKDFPWPEGDRQFKALVLLKAIDHDPSLFRADMISDLKALRGKNMFAFRDLAAPLARHYDQLRLTELSEASFQKLPMATRTNLIRLNEQAALDHWKTITASEALEHAVNRSLPLALAMLEALQQKEHLPIPQQKVFDLLLHCPHPEIKRRVSFIELEGLLTPQEVESQIDAALVTKLTTVPQLGVFQTDHELRKKLVGLVQMGEGTAQGLLEDLEDCSEKSIREFFAETQATTVEASLGFGSLMLIAQSPSTARRASTDQLLRGAMKFEAVAKEFLESKNPELVKFRESLGEEKRLGIIGCHKQMCVDALKSGKPVGISDETKIRWARRHPSVAQELLLKPGVYLQERGFLKRQHIVLMLRHNKDTCSQILLSRRYQSIRDQLQPDDYIEAAKTQDEIAQFLMAAPDHAGRLHLENEHLIRIAKHRNSLLEHYISEPACHPILLSMAPEAFIDLASHNESFSGRLMKLGFEAGIVDKRHCLRVAESSAACRQSILKHLPAEVADEIPAEPAPQGKVVVELPAPAVKKQYMGNLIPFSQSRDFGPKEINNGCCAGFAIDFCLHASDLRNAPEDYIQKRDHWQVNKQSSDYMRRVRHYQRNQSSFAERKNSKTINIDTAGKASQDPEASFITENGKRRLDMPALIEEMKRYGGVFINSVSHAIALTQRPNFDGTSTLYLFDSNHGLYRFERFSEATDQMDDVESLLNNWLMKTGRGMLEIEICRLSDHTYNTLGVSSEQPQDGSEA